MPNRARFDAKDGRFCEVWYSIFNGSASGDGCWVRYTLLNPRDDHPEAGAGLWFVYTCRRDAACSLAIQRNFPRGDFAVRTGEFDVSIGDASLAEGVLRGAFEANGRSASWDLRYEPSAEPRCYFGQLLRREARSLETVLRAHGTAAAEVHDERPERIAHPPRKFSEKH